MVYACVSVAPPPLAAAHEGAEAPFAKVNTSPSGLDGFANLAKAVELDAYNTTPAVSEVKFVPPFATVTVGSCATGNVPDVTLVATVVSVVALAAKPKSDLTCVAVLPSTCVPSILKKSSSATFAFACNNLLFDIPTSPATVIAWFEAVVVIPELPDIVND